MIWFIFFIITTLGISLVTMVHKKKSAKEIGLFITIVSLGFVDWMSIFFERTFNPYEWIGKLIDWIV